MWNGRGIMSGQGSRLVKKPQNRQMRFMCIMFLVMWLTQDLKLPVSNQYAGASTESCLAVKYSQLCTRVPPKRAQKRDTFVERLAC